MKIKTKMEKTYQPSPLKKWKNRSTCKPVRFSHLIPAASPPTLALISLPPRRQRQRQPAANFLSLQLLRLAFSGFLTGDNSYELSKTGQVPLQNSELKPSLNPFRSSFSAQCYASTTPPLSPEPSSSGGSPPPPPPLSSIPISTLHFRTQRVFQSQIPNTPRQSSPFLAPSPARTFPLKNARLAVLQASYSSKRTASMAVISVSYLYGLIRLGSLLIISVAPSSSPDFSISRFGPSSSPGILSRRFGFYLGRYSILLSCLQEGLVPFLSILETISVNILGSDMIFPNY